MKKIILHFRPVARKVLVLALILFASKSNFVKAQCSGTNIPVIASISPTLQQISCTNPVIQPVTVVVGSPTTNITHYFISATTGNTIMITNTPTVTFLPVVDSYSYILTDNTIGCSSNPITFSVVISTAGSPTFQVAGNFTIGCGTHSATTINIVNANTNPTPGGALQFGYIAPGSITSPTNVVNIPGTWTVVVKDLNNGCETRTAVTIIQNTVSPSISVIVPVQVLDCTTPSTTLQGSTTNSNVAFIWLTPTGNVPNVSVTVHTTTNTNNPSAGNYTLTVTDIDNGCTSNTVVPMYQNLFPPHAIIAATNTTLSCLTNTTQLTNVSMPSGLGFPTGIIQALLWQAPAPQPTAAFVSSYIASAAGIYTLTVKDSNNGCTSFTTITIYDTCNVGLNEITYYENLGIYPNPVTSILNIELGNMNKKQISISVYDMFGKRVMNEELIITNSAAQINVSELKQGIYFIKVGNEIEKFVKE